MSPILVKMILESQIDPVNARRLLSENVYTNYDITIPKTSFPIKNAGINGKIVEAIDAKLCF